MQHGAYGLIVLLTLAAMPLSARAAPPISRASHLLVSAQGEQLH
jgi:hypothetical protein